MATNDQIIHCIREFIFKSGTKRLNVALLTSLIPRGLVLVFKTTIPSSFYFKKSAPSWASAYVVSCCPRTVETIVFSRLLFNLSPESQQTGATEAFGLFQQGALYYLCATGRVVFHTQDYAHCDLVKRTVLAIFSRNRMKATLKNVRMLSDAPVSGERAPYLRARDLRFNYASILNEISLP